MKFKRLIFILVMALIVILGTDNVMSSRDVNKGQLYDAYVEYKLSKDYNSETHVEKQKQYRSEITKLENKIEEIEKETEEAKEEQRERMKETEELEENGGIPEELTGEKVYDLVVAAAKDSGTNVERFYTFREDDIYTIQIKGLLGDLDTTLVDLQKAMKDNYASIGNISIRQDYDAYSLEREFDDKTMLGWYNNKIVNAMGDVIDLSELQIEKDSNTDKDVDYTLMTLDDVKLDTEAINREVAASNKRIDDEITELILEYGKQIDIITKSDYEPEVKVELRENIDRQHEEAREKLNDQKDIKKAEIEAKYQRIYEQDKAKVADAIFKYNKKLSELKATLADSSQLEYTMTITLRVR